MLIGRQALLVDNADANQEPPYTEPFVRWCGRTAGVIPPPTRLDLSTKQKGIRLYTKTVKAEIKRPTQTLRIASKDAKGGYSHFLKGFSLRAFSTPLRLCVKCLQPFLGYKPVFAQIDDRIRIAEDAPLQSAL